MIHLLKDKNTHRVKIFSLKARFYGSVKRKKGEL